MNTDEIIRDIADKIFTRSQENLVEDGSIDTGNLLRSGKIYQKGKSTIIEYDAPYAAAIEAGTKPHQVDPADLYKWVRRKLGITNPQEIKRVSFAISQNIAKRGTEPTWFFKRALKSVMR